LEETADSQVMVSGSLTRTDLPTLVMKAVRRFSFISGPAILFLALEVLDGFMTMWATNNGFVEVNPLVSMYSRTWLYPASKVAVTVLGIFLLLPLVERFSRYVRIGFILASVFVGVTVLSNVYEMGLSLA